MSKFLIVMVSKDSTFSIDEAAIHNFYDMWPEFAGFVDIHKISNNMMPLPELYNNILDDEKFKSYDFIIFMHADVSLMLADLLEHIEECKNKYDVMGLCGCSKISVNESPLNWFCGSKNYPESRWGCVTHGEMNNQTSYFSQHSPQVTDHQVACIDGLCIILSRNAIDKGLRFDTKFTFDQYDTDISFSTVMQHKLKLGVLVEKTLHHYSVGKSILSDGFLRSEILLRKKWGLGFPKNSKIASMVTSADPQLSA